MYSIFSYFHIFNTKYEHNILISYYYERRNDIIEIKIIGVNCSNGRKLKKMAYKAVEDIKEDISITEINKDNKKYSITNFPGLIINDRIVSEGKVLTSREIKKLLLSS